MHHLCECIQTIIVTVAVCRAVLKLTKNYMKTRLAIAVVSVAVITGGITLVANKSTYNKIETQIVTETVEKTVPELDKRLQEALTASSTDIEKAMEDARVTAKKKIESEIESAVIEKMQRELDDRVAELEKEVSL